MLGGPPPLPPPLVTLTSCLVIILCLFSSLPETCRSSGVTQPDQQLSAPLQSPGRAHRLPGISPARGLDNFRTILFFFFTSTLCHHLEPLRLQDQELSLENRNVGAMRTWEQDWRTEWSSPAALFHLLYDCLHCSVFSRGRWHLQLTACWLAPAVFCLFLD